MITIRQRNGVGSMSNAYGKECEAEFMDNGKICLKLITKHAPQPYDVALAEALGGRSLTRQTVHSTIEFSSIVEAQQCAQELMRCLEAVIP